MLQFVFLHECGDLLLGHFSLREVVLVANEDCPHFLVGVVAQLRDPVAQVLEGALAGEVEHQQTCDGSFVVGTSDGLKGFLACRIPDLQLDFLIEHMEDLRAKLNAQRRFVLTLEPALHEPQQQTTLAHI